uniref:B-cell receptor CD22 n=1 Tax=Seriola dumerili TaxID=41447 RepID=A0A3B4UI52_SERDU
VVYLIILPTSDWGLTCAPTQICALKGSTVEIRCSYRSPSRLNDADTAVEETFWFTRFSDNEPVDLRADSEYSGRVQYHCGENDCTLRITDLRESDSAEYKFRFITNQPGRKYTGEPGVTLSVTVLPLNVPSVSVNPPGEIMEGGSVTLTCNSNSAAKYTWYKENLPLPNKEPQLVFNSIQSSDSGQYYCAAENELGRRTSDHKFIDVEHAPKLLSVSVSPSGEIVEGMTLTCSSDANPAANYTWYKENEDSPKASGQIFTITDFRPEHSGNYYCEAQNTRGRRNSTLNLIVYHLSVFLHTLLLFILLCLFLQKIIWLACFCSIPVCTGNITTTFVLCSALCCLSEP